MKNAYLLILACLASSCAQPIFRPILHPVPLKVVSKISKNGPPTSLLRVASMKSSEIGGNGFGPATITTTTSVTLAWNPNPEPDIAGYELDYGTVSGSYTQSIATGASTTMVTINNLVPATYFSAVKARNTASVWSAFSNEISFTITAPTPTPTPTATATATATATSTPTATATATATATVPPPTPTPTPDFTLTINPASRTVPSTGGFTSFTINVTPINGFSGSVAIMPSGLPTGVACSGRLGSGVIMMFVCPNLSPGTYTFSVITAACGNPPLFTRTVNASFTKTP